MTNPITALKEYFRHIRTNSWHYKIVKEVWYGKGNEGQQRLAKQKACGYYWFRVPSAIVAYGFGTVFLELILAIFWFGGLRTNRKTRSFYKYKERPDGTRARFAPWEIALPLVIGWILYKAMSVDLLLKETFFESMIITLKITGVLGGIIALVIGCVYIVGRFKLDKKALDAWGAVCPDVVWVDEMPPTPADPPPAAEVLAAEGPEPGDVIGPVP